MTRVGFQLSVPTLGNANYYANLLHALRDHGRGQIEPVLFLGTEVNPTITDQMPPVEVVRSAVFDQKSALWTFRKLSQLSVGGDPILARLLRKHRIDVLSHSDALGRRGGIPTICWFGDFQHRTNPEFFSRLERTYRERDFSQQSIYASRILVSSFDARSQVEQYYPKSVDRVRVLRFVAGMKNVGKETTSSDVGGHPIPARYIYVPNQFWAHKNHGLIADALATLKRRGLRVHVVSTGATDDYRNPDLFPSFLARLHDRGVQDWFSVLGVVPYSHVVALMRGAVCVLNPSRAEGWSTSVEEAKSLGKRVILSDIPVHREQAPLDSLYTDPDDSDGLATAMFAMWDTFEPGEEARRMAEASESLPVRRRAFALEYEDIVADALSGWRDPTKARARSLDRHARGTTTFTEETRR